MVVIRQAPAVMSRGGALPCSRLLNLSPWNGRTVACCLSMEDRLIWVTRYSGSSAGRGYLTPGDSFTGYNYTATMAFEALEARGFTHMCFGYQHQNICCRKPPEGIVLQQVRFVPITAKKAMRYTVLKVPDNLLMSRPSCV